MGGSVGEVTYVDLNSKGAKNISTCLFIHSFNGNVHYTFIYLLIYLFYYLCIYLLVIYLLFYLFYYLCIYLLVIYLLFYLFFYFISLFLIYLFVILGARGGAVG